MDRDMIDNSPVRDLLFRPGEHGFAFYDDTRFGRTSGEPGRAWAFSTIEEATRWLQNQFGLDNDGDAPRDASAAARCVGRSVVTIDHDTGTVVYTWPETGYRSDAIDKIAMTLASIARLERDARIATCVTSDR